MCLSDSRYEDVLPVCQVPAPQVRLLSRALACGSWQTQAEATGKRFRGGGAEVSATGLSGQDVWRAARQLSEKAGMEVEQFLELARRGLRARQLRRHSGRPVWRVGFKREVAGRSYFCVMGQGASLAEALEISRQFGVAEII